MSVSSSRNGSGAPGARRRALVALAISLVWVASVAFAQDEGGRSIAFAISGTLAQTRSTVHFRSPDHGARRALSAIYAGTADQPVWSVNGRATAQSLALVGILRTAEVYGLEPGDYGGDLLARLARRAAAEPAQSARWARLWARFDVDLSAEALRLVCDLHFGRVDARAAGFELAQRRRALDLSAVVLDLARSGNPRQTLASIEPTFEHYRLLELALAKYRRLATEDSALTVLPPIPGRSVKVGERYEGAPALRQLLRAVDDLPPAADKGERARRSAVLDPELVSALERFQQRHGLAADGVLGPSTFRALSTSFAFRVRQIELTLERWRWLPALQTPPIMVNIPQFRLFAFRTTADRAADIVQMNVIVGRAFPRTRTPVFVADMTSVVFRPYWNVPRSITVREMLPQIRANPGFAAAQRLEIVRGGGETAVLPVTAANLAALAAGRLRLRQRPGSNNALGLIKFVLPNRYDVYLHSTPARGLFEHSRRAFSHGCIRVSDPLALAAYVLRDTPGDWTQEKIEAAMHGADDRHVRLAKPIRVMILYGTVLATEAGPVLFFDDLYGQDRRLERLLGLAPVQRLSPGAAAAEYER